MQFRQLLPIFAIRELPNVAPRSVEIEGSRMDLATAVEINGVRTTDFAALSPSRLLVKLAEGTAGLIQSAAVLCEVVQPGMDALVYHDFTTHPRSVSGPWRILQQLIKYLLTTPGSDVFDQRTGGGLRTLLVRNMDKHASNALAGDIETRLLSCVRTVIERQSVDPALPASERLLSASIRNIVFSPEEASLHVDMGLSFHDGSSVVGSFGW